MAKWKYAKRIEVLNECPPKPHEARKRTAFRFVHEDINDSRNWMPVALIPGARPPGASHCCSDFALSFFDDLEKCVAKYKKLTTAYQTLHERIGTCIAKVKISNSDGEATKASKKTTHFDLHEYDSSDFDGKAEVVKRDLIP